MTTSIEDQNAPLNPAFVRPLKRFGSLSADADEAVIEIQQILAKPNPPPTAAPLPILPTPTRATPFNPSLTLPLLASPVMNMPAGITVPHNEASAMRKAGVTSPVPIKLGHPLRAPNSSTVMRKVIPSNVDDVPPDSDASYSSTSDAETNDETDPVTVFERPPNAPPKLKNLLPKLGQSMTDLHRPMEDSARRSFSLPAHVHAEEDEEDEGLSVTPPTRIPNPVPRNSPFWDRANVNGAELGLFSLDNSMPYGDDDDRLQRRMHLLRTPVHAVLKASLPPQHAAERNAEQSAPAMGSSVAGPATQ